MSTHKWIDGICIAAVVLSLLISIIFMNGEAFGIQRADQVMGYVSRLFDTSQVHTIDIVMNDWEGFLETCEDEEYSPCTLVIDGEKYSNIGLRAKGNTSLSNVRDMGSSRYSFKIEFDQYSVGESYHGLDKLCLNNLIQDNTMMKDYLVYQMMAGMGVPAPLCSFAYLTVNGEDWGLYLAVEAIEESFLQRNYGSGYGELYKPDSASNGGGRGNGKDFRMEDLGLTAGEELPAMSENGSVPEMENLPQGERRGRGEIGTPPGAGENPPEMEQVPQGDPPGAVQGENQRDGFPMRGNQGMDGNRGTMGGSEDVKLQYIDDDPASYPNIFDSAKTDVSSADRERLIEALSRLSAGEDLENTLDTDEVIRYFAVHNFVCNGDSYTGSIVHNYYLYEEDGRLSMLPWDYNLSFGTFQGGNASSAVNASINLTLTDRPMVSWIFSREAYTQRYYEVFREFLSTMDWNSLIDSAYSLIAPYVEKDPTKFCTCEEFEAGVSALKTFLDLRTESVLRQLSGDETPVDTGSLNLADMGSMGRGIVDRETRDKRNP